jgi:predicted nucleic acid-binding protein
MWVVDTCVILDVFEDDPEFGLSSAKLLQRLLPEGLTIAPVTFVELSAAFDGDAAAQKSFLEGMGISLAESWTAADTEAAHKAWNTFIKAKRIEKIPKRPVADILIGGFAQNRTGLVTRNGSDFRRWFPKLAIKS